GRSREARAGWGDLSTQAVFVVERPSPHPVSHLRCAQMRADPRASYARPGPLQGRVNSITSFPRAETPADSARDPLPAASEARA
ncbi:hypothetical protein BSZ19_05810, partial [Bradyrhizobium japonicum]